MAGEGSSSLHVLDMRFKPIVRQVAKAFNLPAFEVEEAMCTDSHIELILSFLSVDGPRRLIVGLRSADGSEPVEPDGSHLFMTAAEDLRITSKAVLVVKLTEEELTASNIESDVMVGVMQGSPIKTLLAMLQHVYMPSLAHRTADWGARLPEESSQEFLGSVGKFVEMLGEAVSSLESGLELAKP